MGKVGGGAGQLQYHVTAGRIVLLLGKSYCEEQVL